MKARWRAHWAVPSQERDGGLEGLELGAELGVALKLACEALGFGVGELAI